MDEIIFFLLAITAIMASDEIGDQIRAFRIRRLMKKLNEGTPLYVAEGYDKAPSAPWFGVYRFSDIQGAVDIGGGYIYYIRFSTKPLPGFEPVKQIKFSVEDGQPYSNMRMGGAYIYV